MQIFWQSLKMVICMTVLTGFIYPLVILMIANLTMPKRAQGSIIYHNEKPIGSKLVGQQFTSDRYFWGRPSTVNYATLPAAASNLGPTSTKLQVLIQKRRFRIAQAHGIQNLSLIPTELICASGSGIDPHISLGTAYFQLARVAKARALNGNAMVLKIEELINNSIDKSYSKLFGERYVNVLMLNLKLDEFAKENK